jgi:hypothetical protein
MIVSYPKILATVLFASVLATPSPSQQVNQISVPELAAATAFERAMQAEAGRNLERIYAKRIRDLCAADDRGWGSGVVGYDRVTFVNEQELPSKMLTLVREWKTTGSKDPPFDASDFPRLRRYAVANCGVVGGQIKVVVAVYRSAWDTYWDRWANLLGK